MTLCNFQPFVATKHHFRWYDKQICRYVTKATAVRYKQNQVLLEQKVLSIFGQTFWYVWVNFVETDFKHGRLSTSQLKENINLTLHIL